MKSMGLVNHLADFNCIPFHSGRPQELCYESFRAHAPIHVQVDSQLAIRGRGTLSLERFLRWSYQRTSCSALLVWCWQMAETCKCHSSGSNQSTDYPPFQGATKLDRSRCHSGLHPLNHPLCTLDWLPMRKESALPVFRIHRMVGAVSAVAKWHASRVDLCNLHRAGMGVECISKHRCELHGGYRLLSSHCGQRMDRYQSIYY